MAPQLVSILNVSYLLSQHSHNPVAWPVDAIVRACAEAEQHRSSQWYWTRSWAIRVHLSADSDQASVHPCAYSTRKGIWALVKLAMWR